MLTSQVGQALLRRWHITLVGLLLTVALGYVGTLAKPLLYHSSASYLLVPPTEKPGANPYLALSGMREITEVLARSMMDDQTAEDLKAAGVDGKYFVDRDSLAAGPILIVLGEADSPAQSTRNRDLAGKLLPTRLNVLQEQLGVPEASRITSKVLRTDLKPEAQMKDLMRLLIAVVGLGGFTTVASVLLLDRWLRRRALRRRALRVGDGVVGQGASGQGAAASEAEDGKRFRIPVDPEDR